MLQINIRKFIEIRKINYICSVIKKQGGKYADNKLSKLQKRKNVIKRNAQQYRCTFLLIKFTKS